MPMHDWTRVGAGVFHSFHRCWTIELKRVLNDGGLPPNHYALLEQAAVAGNPLGMAPPERSVDPRLTDAEVYARRKNVVTVRREADDGAVAMVEIVSPGDTATRGAVERVAETAAGRLRCGVHLLVIDPFPSVGPGLHAAVWRHFADAADASPSRDRRTVVGYDAGDEPTAYVETLTVGDLIPEMPLFLKPGESVRVPLEATYASAFAAVPRRWRAVIEAA